jgi:hypothetical protein
MSNRISQEEQERVWNILYRRLNRILPHFGREDFKEPGDYYVFDDNWGSKQHKVTMYSLNMFRPVVIRALQSVLTDFPDWEVIVVPCVRGVSISWPDMGLAVRAHEIVDGIHWQYFPTDKQFQYPGSRRGVV